MVGHDYYDDIKYSSTVVEDWMTGHLHDHDDW